MSGPWLVLFQIYESTVNYTLTSKKRYNQQFNERRTSRLLTFFLALPMFAAFALARAFTLAVFLKVMKRG